MKTKGTSYGVYITGSPMHQEFRIAVTNARLRSMAKDEFLGLVIKYAATHFDQMVECARQAEEEDA